MPQTLHPRRLSVRLQSLLAGACLLAGIAAPLRAADDDLSANARLLVAARAADAPAMERALKGGAAVNSRNRLGESPLVVVLKNNHPELAGALLVAGADVNLAAINGITPLMAASYIGATDVVRALLRGGADVNAVDRLRKNAMTYAAGEGHVGVVRALLEAGVDADAVYHNDLTALMWAAGYGRIEVVRVLLDAGARPERRDDRGKTALDIAREQKQDATAAVLEPAVARVGAVR
jgi:uncharacterized protein